MKKFVLAAISAKYIHSSLALRYLSKFEQNNKRHRLETVEFTINQRDEFILEELFRLSPDVFFFSCYIWNIELVRRLCSDLKKILPQCRIVLGGPEVSFGCEEFLRENPAVEIIIRGEGELTFTQLLDVMEDDNCVLSAVNGIAYVQNGQFFSAPDRKALELARLPFPYDSFEGSADKIIYYESSRGCPYRCSYCLSSVEKGVRFVPTEKVFGDLQRFLDARVRQVKFVDRTFNCDRRHTMAVWEYLAAHDNGVTNFHFELTADLLDEAMLTFLRPLRKGLFQFEIGVQSTNPETLRAINRCIDFAALSSVVRGVKAGGNIHQHLDLIAGLPYEDYNSFARSFNDVYALQPEQLQLGFLKVLKGSPIEPRCAEFGITAHSRAPYEVLFTNWLPHSDLLRLKAVEEMTELFYNSGAFLHSTACLVSLFATPFLFYEKLAEYWVAGGHHRQSHSRAALCDILWGFARELPAIHLEEWMWLLKFDLCLRERPKKFPAWLTTGHNAEYRARMLEFYQNSENLARFLPQYLNYDERQIYRLAHIEVFGGETEKRQAVLFNYDRHDLLGNAEYYKIKL